MSNYESLIHFNRNPVSNEMIDFLSSTTESIINVQEARSISNIALPPPSLTRFIKNLVLHSNVQTPTLMATSVYLAKLRAIIPNNVYGIETTRHRIFLGCLILAAKTLNDSSPLNKHWAKYTDGLLTICEVNTIERELLEYFDWNVIINTKDLITCLEPLLKPIKERQILTKINQGKQNLRQDLLLFNSPTQNQLKYYNNNSPHHKVTASMSSSASNSSLSSYASSNILHSRSDSNYSIPSLESASTLSTLNSRRSKYSTNIPMIPEAKQPLMNKNPHNISLENKENSSSTPVKPLIIRNTLIKVKPLSNTVDYTFNSSYYN